MPLPPHLGFEAVFHYPRFNPNSDIYFFSEFRTAERRIYRHECSIPRRKGNFSRFEKRSWIEMEEEGCCRRRAKKDLSRLVLSLGKKTETLPCGEKERERRMLKKRWKNRGEWKEKRRRKRVVAKQVLAVSSTLLQLSLFDASPGHPL